MEIVPGVHLVQALVGQAQGALHQKHIVGSTLAGKQQIFHQGHPRRHQHRHQDTNQECWKPVPNGDDVQGQQSVGHISQQKRDHRGGGHGQQALQAGGHDGPGHETGAVPAHPPPSLTLHK